MENNPKILVGCPTYSVMKYCHKEFFNRIKNLSYENYDILIVDNSRDDEYFEKLKKEEGIKAIKDTTPETINKKRLISSRNKILQYASDNSYDFLLMMDSDVIPPENIIGELLGCNKEIVSGLYFNYFVSSGKTKYLPVAWHFITPHEFQELKKTTAFPPIVKSHLDLRRHLIPKEYESNKLLRVRYTSAGCMLLNKKVFEKIRYGLLDVPNKKSTGDDIYFFEKAHEAGFDIYCHTGIKCEHLIMGKFEKDTEGNLFHPLFK